LRGDEAPPAGWATPRGSGPPPVVPPRSPGRGPRPPGEGHEVLGLAIRDIAARTIGDDGVERESSHGFQQPEAGFAADHRFDEVQVDELDERLEPDVVTVLAPALARRSRRPPSPQWQPAIGALHPGQQHLRREHADMGVDELDREGQAVDQPLEAVEPDQPAEAQGGDQPFGRLRPGRVLRTVPSAPRSPTATPRPRAVRLTWTAPRSSGGAAVTDYVVQRATRRAGPWTGSTTACLPPACSPLPS
jgi:hypothetical protein